MATQARTAGRRGNNRACLNEDFSQAFANALQFDFLRRTASQTTPLLLLDDIFDKLDSHRVEQIVKLVSGDGFGQIFITDTNRDHLDQILRSVSYDYKLFEVEGGEIREK